MTPRAHGDSREPEPGAPAAALSFSCACGASIVFQNQTDGSPALGRFGWRYTAGKHYCPNCRPKLEERLR